MITGATLALWLRSDPAQHAKAMSELIESGDLTVVEDSGGFGLVRSHGNAVTRYETGTSLPPLPVATA